MHAGSQQSLWRCMVRTLSPRGLFIFRFIDRCIAAAMVKMATGKGTSAFYLGGDAKTGMLPGRALPYRVHRAPALQSVFLSRPGILRSRMLLQSILRQVLTWSTGALRLKGTITPPGKYLVVQTCASVPDSLSTVKAISCFGNAEQIRNLSALVHFDRADPFSPVIVPWGPACATIVTYPAGIAAHAPADSAFMGPQDPTINRALPPDLMAIGLPIAVAGRVAENIDRSFITKRPRLLFPRP